MRVGNRTGLVFCLSLLVFAANSLTTSAMAATFGDDIAFLRKHTDIIVLRDDTEAAQVAIAPAWQGRVMTSTNQSTSGRSFGWINRELIASGKPQPHMHAFGGEDRFWMGPEGGQYSIFFAPGVPFDYEDWFVPKVLDTLPFQTVSKWRDRADFRARFELTNYTGTRFTVGVQREIRLLDSTAAWQRLGLPPSRNIALVAYESNNTLINAGDTAWTKQTGLLSIWILGMFAPSPSTTIVVPIKPGSDSQLGKKVRSDYFGAVPPERLKVTDRTIFFSGDGKYRSKIGINPRRSQAKLGSYDSDNHALTLVLFDQPNDTVDYVNSLWKLQEEPYGGDAVNSYNDGPEKPGAKPLGPFYELESSSPAAALAPGGSLKHTHRTFHLTGSEQALDPIARKVLGVSLAEIQTALMPK